MCESHCLSEIRVVLQNAAVCHFCQFQVNFANSFTRIDFITATSKKNNPFNSGLDAIVQVAECLDVRVITWNKRINSTCGPFGVCTYMLVNHCPIAFPVFSNIRPSTGGTSPPPAGYSSIYPTRPSTLAAMHGCVALSCEVLMQASYNTMCCAHVRSVFVLSVVMLSISHSIVDCDSTTFGPQ